MIRILTYILLAAAVLSLPAEDLVPAPPVL